MKIKKIIAVFAFLSVLACALFFVYENYYKITNLFAEQNDLNIDINWDNKKSKSFDVTISWDNKQQEYSITENNFSFPLPEAGKEYSIRVTSAYPIKLFDGEQISVNTSKLSQEIKVSDVIIEGFVGDSLKITANANSNILIDVKDKEVANVTNNTVMLNNEGITEIELIAQENKFYTETSKTIQLTSYPQVLNTPILEIEELSDTESKLSWQEIPFANRYTIEKFNEWTGKFEIYKQQKETEITVPKDNSNYRVLAHGVILNKKLNSKVSAVKNINVKEIPHLETYTVIKEITKSNIEDTIYLSPPTGTVCPQSFSPTEDGFLVAFSNNTGTVGALSEYSIDGDLLRSDYVSMGHANGSTYNPKTKRIYTLRKHGEIKSKMCNVFHFSNFADAETFDMPIGVSAIGYDLYTDKYALAAGDNIYIADTDFNIEISVPRMKRYLHTQDCNASNGIIVSCSWNEGNNSYIDLYRESDGAYLGTYTTHLGEIESAAIVKGKLVLLINNASGFRKAIFLTDIKIY